ncbi:MAG: nucleotide exchange factor GrpE [Bacteroidota bacterium]
MEENKVQTNEQDNEQLTAQDENTTVEEQANAENQTEEKEGAGRIQELEKANMELKDKYLRLAAEFDNYKKRTLKERIELMKTAAQDTVSALLPVLDDFDRAKKNADNENTEESFSEGVSLVYNKLYGALKQQGLEPMESNGEVFDPEFHEAITEIPAGSEDMKGKVVDTIEKGYLLKDKIIRYAKVVVGK